MYDCARSAITFNNLNLPSYDVHSRQARDTMLVNLYSLQESFVKINNHLTEKSKEQNEKIEKIRARIQKCHAKIVESENAKKAISFLSPPEYPVKYKFDPQKNLSVLSSYLERTRVNKFDLNAHYQMKHEVEQLGQQSKLELENLYKFVLYLYGTLKSKKMSKLESGIATKKVKHDTLGKIPSQVRYVDSLIVFDTYVNPYKKYELIQKKESKKKVNKKQQEEPNYLDMKTIVDYVKPEYDPDNPNYKPNTKDVEEIVFDENLGLDNIVDIDIDDFLNAMPTSTKVVEKNVVEDPYKNANASQQNLQSQQTSPPQSSSNQSNLPPPPPPPPPPPSSNSFPPGPPSSLPPPPPPPPPPIGLPSAPSGKQNSVASAPPAGPPPAPVMSSGPSMPGAGGSDRSKLMQQLINPNPMARLKKTVTKETPNLSSEINNRAGPSNSNPGAVVGDGDAGPPRAMTMMEQLQQKIKNRFIALHPEREEEADGAESD